MANPVIMKVFLALSLAVFISHGAATKSRNQELIVAVPASLEKVLTSIKQGYEAKHHRFNLLLNISSSGHLANQLIEGAPIDVFISADPSQTKWLEEKGLLIPGSVKKIAFNSVVLAVPAKSRLKIDGWADLAKEKVKKIAIGDPAHVPVGQTGANILRELGFWESVKKKCVYGEDARQVINMVAMGEVDAGIVYNTDTLAFGKVHAIAGAAKSHRVSYVLALAKDSANPLEAKRFYQYLKSSEVRSILSHFGFNAAYE